MCNNFWLNTQIRLLDQFKFFCVGIEHENGHTTSTFQNHSSENKLLQELGDKIFIIISNIVQSEVSPFIKFICKDWLKNQSFY